MGLVHGAMGKAGHAGASADTAEEMMRGAYRPQSNPFGIALGRRRN
jgi:hypothetical protein